jgi:hypothetical protein
MVIDAWAKSRVPGAAQYAEEILKRMQLVYLHPATQSEQPLSAYGYNAGEYLYRAGLHLSCVLLVPNV